MLPESEQAGNDIDAQIDDQNHDEDEDVAEGEEGQQVVGPGRDLVCRNARRGQNGRLIY